MRVQIWSDLHREFNEDPRVEKASQLKVDASADLLVLAGDIDVGDASFEFAQRLSDKAGKPVAWVPGNHEFYHRDLQRQMERFHQLAAAQTGVIALLDSEARVGNLRLLGGTLWTDFELYMGAGRMPTREDAVAVADCSLNDFRVIQVGARRFTAQQSLDLHNATRAFLSERLDTPFEGPTLVVTHHAPHRLSVAHRYAPDSRQFAALHRLPNEDTSWMATPCFVSNLPELTAKANLWVHGHVHDSFDFRTGVGKLGQVVANPRGYPRLNRNGDIVFENSAFEPVKLVDLN